MIYFLEQIKMILSDMLRNRLRVLLTMTGTIIGVLSVILIISVGNAATLTVNSYFTGTLGTNSITSYISIPGDADYNQYVLRYEEMKEISSKIDGSVGVIAESPDVIYGQINSSDDNYVKAVIKGVTPACESGTGIQMVKGRFINDYDCGRCSAAAVISDIAAVNCYGSADEAIGKTFILRNDSTLVEASVVGVYKYVDTKGKTERIDDMKELVTNIYCPYEFVNKCSGVNQSGLYSFNMTIIVDDIEKTDRALLQFDELMNSRRTDPEYSAFTYKGFNDADQIKSTIKTTTLVFICSAALSLIVGGITLMNTLLVTVKERTREIGIKKAIGAGRVRIIFQFLLESVVICISACFIGFILSLIALEILRQNLSSLILLISDEELRSFLMTNGIEIKLDFSSVVTAVVFSIGVSQIFGIYPAFRASGMQVIDALRYE